MPVSMYRESEVKQTKKRAIWWGYVTVSAHSDKSDQNSGPSKQARLEAGADTQLDLKKTLFEKS